MPIGVPIIDNPMQLSSNFIVSVETSKLNGYNVGDDVVSMVDNSGTGNSFVSNSTPRYSKFLIDAEGYKCVDFNVVGGVSYMTSNTYVQPNEITYCGVFDVNVNGAITTSFMELFNSDTFSFIPTSQTYLGLGSISFALSQSVIPLKKNVILVRRSLTRIELWVNGALVYFNTYTTLSLLNSPRRFYVSSNGSFKSKFYGIHVCTEYLDDVKIKKLMRYCAFKAGIKI